MKRPNAKPSRTGWLYLAGILDLYRRKIWAMGPRIDTELVVNALHRAVRHRQPPRGLLFHSDCGVQSASADYRGALDQAGRVASMSRQGNDNAAKESFWSTLQWELVFRRAFATRLQAQSEIFDYLEVFYNRQRSHSAWVCDAKVTGIRRRLGFLGNGSRGADPNIHPSGCF
jgi:putative transposase